MKQAGSEKDSPISFPSYDECRFTNILSRRDYEDLISSWERYRDSLPYRRVRDFVRNQRQKGIAIKLALVAWSMLPHLGKIYLKKTFTNRPIFRSLEVSMTYRCNYACDQCSCRRTYNPDRKELEPEDYFRVIDQAIELGAFQFNLTGGEPLLRRDLVLQIISYVKSKKRFAHLCTNASLISDNLDDLAEAGLCSLEMGLDSADPDEHDANRREGSFDQIRQLTKESLSRNIPVILNTVITKLKIRSFDMVALGRLAKEWGAHLQVTPPCLTGAWKGRTEIVLNDEERLFHLWLLGLPSVRSDIFSGLRITACTAGREKLAITPYGDVVPCSLIQVFYGNVREAGLSEIWRRIRDDRFFTEEKACRLGCPSSFDWEFIRAKGLDQPDSIPQG